VSLNRAQKRNLALLLVGRAKSIVADWENISGKHYNEIEDGGLEGISQEDVRDVYGQWLGYLPNKAWDRVDEPEASPAGLTDQQAAPASHADEQQAGSVDRDIDYRDGAPVADDSATPEHVNVALSDETPIMGSNEIVPEDDVRVHDVDEDPTGDEQVVQQSAAGGPQPFQYR
jgi:hypothetical protein